MHCFVRSVCMMIACSLVTFRMNILFPSSGLNFSTLKMEVVSSSRCFLSTCPSETLYHNPERHAMNVHLSHKLRFCLYMWPIAVACSWHIIVCLNGNVYSVAEVCSSWENSWTANSQFLFSIFTLTIVLRN